MYVSFAEEAVRGHRYFKTHSPSNQRVDWSTRKLTAISSSVTQQCGSFQTWDWLGKPWQRLFTSFVFSDWWLVKSQKIKKRKALGSVLARHFEQNLIHSREGKYFTKSIFAIRLHMSASAAGGVFTKGWLAAPHTWLHYVSERRSLGWDNETLLRLTRYIRQLVIAYWQLNKS